MAFILLILFPRGAVIQPNHQQNISKSPDPGALESARVG
jgi:hypothetical protein